MDIEFNMDLGGLDRLISLAAAKEIDGGVRGALEQTAEEMQERVKDRAPIVSGALQQSIGIKSGKRSKSPYVAIKALPDRVFAVPGHFSPVRPVAYAGQRDLETGFITNSVSDDDVERLRARIEKIVRDVLNR